MCRPGNPGTAVCTLPAAIPLSWLCFTWPKQVILEDLRAEELATPQEKRWALLLGAGTWPEVRARCFAVLCCAVLCCAVLCQFCGACHACLCHPMPGQHHPCTFPAGGHLSQLSCRPAWRVPCTALPPPLQVLRRLVLTRAADEDNPDQ